MADHQRSIPLVIVAAVARNGVIGGDNRLLWRLSSDLRRFKAVTLGKPMIMGRKTFQSIGKPLPGRETIVVTRDAGFSADGVHIAGSLEEGLALAEKRAQAMGAEEIIIAGGGDIYAQTMPLADKLIVTEVALAPAGDATFPPVDPAIWREKSRETPPRTERDEAPFTFLVYERR
jgi:dihydrofolate reductase